MSAAVTHAYRIRSINRGPHLPKCWQFVCDCGASSPECVDKQVAVLARRSHLRENGLGE